MKKLTFILFCLAISTGIFSRSAEIKIQESSVPAKLVAKIYNIYKTQSYKSALKITTGTMKKRFTKLYNYLRMNQYRVPARLKKLSARLHEYRFVGQYNKTYKGRKYSLVDCLWVMKYRDMSRFGSGIVKTKVILRAYLVKKIKGRWKVSSEKFITEYILRGEEVKRNRMIRKKIQIQRMRRMRRNRYRGGRYRGYYYRRRNG